MGIDMVYLGIALILLVIIAPIIAVLPSARQKATMRLRRTAMAAGFSIDFVHIDDPDPDPQAYLSSTGKPLPRTMAVVAYRYPRKRTPDWRRLAPLDWSVVRQPLAASDLPAGWAWVPRRPDNFPEELQQILANGLARLPDDVVRVDEVKYVISVYWQESGDESSLETIVDFVRACGTIAVVVPLDDEPEITPPTDSL